MFTHLHVHSEYSLLDGLSKVEPLVKRAKEMGQNALAITDHGALYGAIEFYEAAKKYDVKPILGIEAYVAPKSRFDKDPKSRWPHHLTMLATSETGYSNLIKLSSASHLEGFYYRPRMDKELLEQHSEGLIVLSGCPSGEFMSALRDGDEKRAMEVAGWYADVYKGRYYLEVMDHGIAEFSALMPKVAEIGKRMGLPLVVTNDSHYTHPDDHRAHEVLLCIGSNTTVHDEKRFKLDGNTFYLRSEAEMRSVFPTLPEAADNTQVIAEQVDIKLNFGRTMLPDPGVPAGTTARDWLRELCVAGLYRRYGHPTESQHERLRYELEVVAKTGFDEYMLIVRDIAHYAKEHGIRMGVRGSAASSIILYTLDVTDIDPLEYGLVFERFLNPERISMPDVDFDFADDRREEVIRYTVEKYGRDRVAQICTFGTLGAKAALRDSGRALGMDYAAADRVARMVPETLNITLEDALSHSQEMAAAYETEAAVRELVDTARKLEGVARHASTHAAGVVISREPLVEVVPLQRATKKDADDETGVPTTQYAMAEIEKIGLLKIDYLGLTNLTILGKAIEEIERRRGERIDLLTIPDGDEAAAELLAAGETFGVFQMESAGMRRYVVDLKPKDIRELSAMVALFRPGPLEHIPRFIDVKHGRVAPYYAHEDLRPILDETYGVITYQEQVLQIARTFAGYSLGQADVMRKAMGKKNAAVMVEERSRFLDGIRANGYTEKLGNDLFDLIQPFSGYAFNKAHATCYGVIAYQTAYLKAHYTVEYMCAVLQSASGNTDRIAAALAECHRLGIPVMAPDVNRSEANFAIEVAEDGRDGIRYGLAQIKNVGAGAVEGLLAERRGAGPFASLEDFARRISAREINKRVLEALARAGAMDSLGSRGGIIGGLDRILSLAQQEQRLRETGQTSMFDLFGAQVATPLPALEIESVAIPQQQLLQWEKELLGTYLSEHPFQQASHHLAEWVTHTLSEVTADLVGQEAVIAGTVVGVRSLATKQGKAFAAVTLEDLSGQTEVVVWSDQYEPWKARGLLFEGTVLMMKVTIRQRGDRLTVAATEATAYDYEAGRPADANLSRFIVRRTLSQLRAAEESPSYPGPASPPPAPGPGRRPDLRIVAPDERPASESVEMPPSAPRADLTGPHRLVITMEETTDQAADLRRLQRICALLDEHQGDTAVEIAIRQQGGATARFRRGGVDPAALDELLKRLRGLLGVLGDAREAGGAAASDALAVAAGG
ncbi:MAG: DNA polymerase III subunit alpha [Dehalococcoidia bacterium]|nr:MAG: DNA polymerase III subunit alpha [Dehalococcoidia bacterium]